MVFKNGTSYCRHPLSGTEKNEIQRIQKEECGTVADPAVVDRICNL